MTTTPVPLETGGAPPISEEVARRAAGCVLDHPGAEEVEVFITASVGGVTRFAGSQIIQNTVREELRAHVRVALADRAASASTNRLDGTGMTEAAGRALAAARASPPDDRWRGLPSPDEVGTAPKVWRFDEDTIGTTPDARATAVKSMIGISESDDAAGIYETSGHAFAAYSSAGMAAYDAFSRCVTICLIDLGESTGWGDASSHDRAKVDHEGCARTALAKARAGANAIDVPPGAYEVVLEPSAVAVLVDYLGYAGFGAKQVLEGESFLASRAGERVAADIVTVSDDVDHPLSVGIGFDFEGLPRRRVRVIDAGRATGPVTDWRTAPQLGTEPTGHFSGSNEFGPYASNLVLDRGSSSMEELVASVEDGLLVTRFHYVNIVDRMTTQLTGMTRDGTFRISKGEIGPAVHNLRFTESALDALAGAEGLGSELKGFAPEDGAFGSTVVPALRTSEFHFTSATSH